MIELTIFEQNEVLKNKIKSIIYKYFGSREDNFKIIDYNNYTKSENQKIYILSSDNFSKVIELSKSIRNSSDFSSPIIILSNIKKENLNNNLLILSYINYDQNTFNNLRKALNDAYNILTENNTFNFICDKTIYRVSLNDILFIEKENNSNRCIIHTKSRDYKINYSIKKFENRVTSIKFIKVHKSCIVNIDNVTKYDFINNILYFKNTRTDLIAREKKTILKEHLLLTKEKD